MNMQIVKLWEIKFVLQAESTAKKLIETGQREPTEAADALVVARNTFRDRATPTNWRRLMDAALEVNKQLAWISTDRS